MYERFYGFSEGPFESGPDPRFLYLTPSHSEAFSGMLSGVRERKGITVVTGDPGTGKTTLIRALLSELDEKVKTAFIVFTLLQFRELLKGILYELGIPARGQDTFALLETFHLYLLERSQDQIVAIIIDEAQGLDTSVLGDLMGLWAGRDPQHLQLQTVLVGHPELDAKLDSQELRSLHEEIAVRHHIRPLTQQESNVFIDHRLRIVGSSSSEVFKPAAVDRICDCAEGNPRVITAVCHGSLLIGYAKCKRKIDARIVNEAIQDLRLSPPGKARRRLQEPLPVEELRPGASAPEPIFARWLRWKPVYRLPEWVRSLKPALQAAQLRTFLWKPVYRLLEWIRSLKPALHPAQVRTLRWKPVYQLPEQVRLLKTALRPAQAWTFLWRPVYRLLEWVRSLKPVPHSAYRRKGPVAVPEPVPVRRARWRPVYQILTGALSVTVALGLLVLSTSNLVPQKETKGEGIGPVIVEESATLSVPAEKSQAQNQEPPLAPSTLVKKARPQPLVHKQAARPQAQRLTHKEGKLPPPLAYEEEEPPQRLAHHEAEPPQSLAPDVGEPPQPIVPHRLNDAEQDDLLLKQDAAWRMLQR